MIRTFGLLASLAALAACGDGRGSPYSSARAQTTPYAAGPATGAPVLASPIAVTPGAVPIRPGGTGQAAVTTAALAPAAAPAPAVRFATGPIYSACLGAGRAGATETRCGCVQWVADRQLTAGQQRRGAGYFNDQQDLQEARQSGNSSDSEFWTAWRKFGASAGDLCRAS